MGKRLRLIAFLTSTALVVPSQASAGPVVPFVLGALTNVGVFVPVAAGSFGAYSAGIAAGGFLFGSFAGRAVLALGASAVLGQLAPSMPKFKMPTPAAQFANYSQPISYFERVYGEVKKGGTVAFRSGIVGGKRHMVIILAAHSIAGITQHALDLRDVEIDGSGNVLTSPMDGYVNLRPFTGKVGQTADATLLAEFSDITANHDFAGHSGIACWFKAPPQDKALTIYTQGEEAKVLPVMRGWDEIYDPRTDTYGYSNNWALCFAHELVNVWGFDVDWERVVIEADICDQFVTNRDGGQQRRYTFNHRFDAEQDFEAVKTTFLAAANGFVWQRPDGKVDFYAGRYMSPEFTLEQADILGDMAVVWGNRGLRPTTDFFAEYREPDNDYRETPSALYHVQDGLPSTRAVELHAVDSHNQALRALKPMARAERSEFKVSAVIGWAGLEIIAGRDHEADTTGGGGLAHRFIAFNHPAFPTGTVFEVSKLDRRDDGDSFEIELTSTASSDWAFDAATEEPAPPKYNSGDVAESDPVATIDDLAAEAVTSTGGLAQIRWFWTAADPALIPVLYIRRLGDEYAAFELPGGTSEYTQTGAVDGATYEGQIRLRTTGYITGNLKPDSPLTVVAVANTDAPAQMVSLTLSETAGDVTVDIEAPNDQNYYAARIYRADYPLGYSGSYDINDAALVRLEYGPPGAVDQWVDTGVPADTPHSGGGVSGGTHATYWVVSINASGIAASALGPNTIDIT